jgi:hypothetical protein
MRRFFFWIAIDELCFDTSFFGVPVPDPEMVIKKNKNPQARPQIFLRFFNPYRTVGYGFSFWKSQTWQVSILLVRRIFFLRFLNP